MKFRFFIGGYHSGHFEVFLKKDKLYVFHSNHPMRIENEEPTHKISIAGDTEWQYLIQYISTLNWKLEYNSDILDGIQWELIFANQGHQLNSNGSNSFPDEFADFTKLLSNIMAKHHISTDLLQDDYSD